MLPVCKFGKMKVSDFIIFLSCVLSAVICVPSNLADNASDDDAPVKYDGAQLWRIPIDKEDSKQIVSELQENFGKLKIRVNSKTIFIFEKIIRLS